MNIEKLVKLYMNDGYNRQDAEAKVSQDIILIKISKSKFSRNITVKGGVVMHSISSDIRRATRDLDLDFIRYSLEDESIINFIKQLNDVDDNIKIEVVGKIKPLHHQDYDGKRVLIKLIDISNNSLNTKLDIGVHKLFEIEQDEYCFNFDIAKENANLLINSKEQIFTEKLKSLLKLGVASTRYKDVFDFYYLINIAKLDNEKLKNCFDILIFNDEKMRENNIQDILKRLEMILNIKAYRDKLNDPKVNWLDISLSEVIESVLKYIENLDSITSYV